MLLTRQERATAPLTATPPGERINILAVVGHDLRQPLSAAIMAIEFAGELLETAACENPAQAQVGIAQRCIRQALRLADDLLTMGQAEAGALRLHRSPVDLATLLEETRALIEPHAQPKRVALQIVVPPSLPRPMADRERLLQVLGNVCGNAVKFTPTGGYVALAATERGGAIEVSVTDSGPGVGEDQLPHVFEQYWRSGHAAAGAGLGLAIARWIVDAHGGSIEARRAHEGGLTVAFTIPLLAPAEAASARG